MSKINTTELARLLRVREQTIRNAYSRDGHYLNLRPTKMPSRLLLWDEKEAMEMAGIVGQPAGKESESSIATGRKVIVTTESMSIRDQFALAAMQGLLANPEWWNHIGGTDSKEAAKVAYIHADAMLYARLRKSAGDD